MALRYERLSALQERAGKLERRTDSLFDTASEKGQRLLKQHASVQDAADELESDLDDLERWLPEVREFIDHLEAQLMPLNVATQPPLAWSLGQSSSPMN